MSDPERDREVRAKYRPGPHWVAVAAAVFTWPLLLSGAQVTSYGVGLAVPDWPKTFGINMFLYDFWNASWGVFIEHRHRLYGSAVGMACIVLAVWFTLRERRWGMIALGWLALAAVIAQGLLGGARVLYQSTPLAFLHGCTAQAFFGFMVALGVLTGRHWREGDQVADPDHFRRRSAVMLALVYGQIVAGAWLRHFGSVAALILHAVLALAVWGHAAALVWRIERRRAGIAELVPSVRAMALAVTVQVLLGLAAWWMLRPFDGLPHRVTTLQALIRTAHLGNGALLLASVVVLALRSYRHLIPSSTDYAPHESSPAPRDLETVA